MKISKLLVSNFRLLEGVELCLEDGATVIVGRNNSGKTSLTELFRRLLDEKSPRFKLEDFSLGIHEKFWNAFQLYLDESEEAVIRNSLPTISTTLFVEYEADIGTGSLADFVIDLNEDCTLAEIHIRYELHAGKIGQLFEGIERDKEALFKELKERIPKFFRTTIEAQDPNDPTNTKVVDFTSLRSLLQVGFINAQRALDDVSNKEKAVLGKIFERLFLSAASERASAGDQTTVNTLKTAVTGVQDQIDGDFNEQLQNLIPAFDLFGYPGLTDPQLRTQTVLKVEQLLSNHTTVGYLGVNGINLPESYNGLGPRNLIFILLKLFEFFKDFKNRQAASGIHMVFIEEPEAHLHPQMQSVFIRKLVEIRNLFVEKYNDGDPWPVQFIVTTHSSHIANEASFDSMRYFLTKPRQIDALLLKTEVKDLRNGLSGEEEKNREFLHKYMTLTRCDLLFADKAILIEGTTERLLLPEMISKSDENAEDGIPSLGSQYLTIMEVGGAYAHLFFNLIDFLNLQTLVITDLDSIDQSNNGSKCKVSNGTHSSNACINKWFTGIGENRPTKDELLEKTEEEKISGHRRLAFQISHSEGDACGRSFEDAFMLANPAKFGLNGETANEREQQSWDKAEGTGKTDFALRYAIRDTEWVVPRYIEEGLKWLAGTKSSEETTIVKAVEEVEAINANTDA